MITRIGSKVLKTLAFLLIAALMVAMKISWDATWGSDMGMGGWGRRSFEEELVSLDRKLPPPQPEFRKFVHFDLKGAPPKMSYLITLLRVIRSAGGNGILVEYEDAFPFSGSIRNISSATPYSPVEIAELISTATELGMEVIPLVQTFGHLEYVLKQEEFRRFREVDDFPTEICPSNKEAVAVIKEMIRQVMELHRNSTHIHIGSDEVWNLGKCSVCSRKKSRKLFAEHVYRIASYVRATYPGVVPLIWDDMLRSWSLREVQESGLTFVVEPVVWVYGSNIANIVPHVAWYTYLRSFPRVWAASAFKGASGSKQVLPNVAYHLDNNLAWSKFIKNRKDRVDSPPNAFAGIFITGWSRYDHFAILCELLPASIPSLVASLALLEDNFRKISSPVREFDERISHRVLEILNCPRSVPLVNESVIKTPKYQETLEKCEFPGSDVFHLAHKYVHMKTRQQWTVQKVESSAWLTDYNVRTNFSNPHRLKLLLTHGLEEDVYKNIGMFKSEARDILGNYYEDHIVEEWIEQYVLPVEVRLNSIHRKLKDLMRRRTWPRRPLP